jgi:N4-gp56 family major capsid protein
MASETTTAADLIVPEVWGPAVMSAILKKAVLASLVTNDETLVGQPGDTISFPKFGYIGDAVDLSEGVAIELKKLTMTDSSATIKEAGTGIELTDTALATALGRPLDQAVGQLATSIARKIDTDIRVAAESTVGTSPLIVATAAAKLDWEAVTAGIALLGDEWDPAEMAGLVIHSAQHVSLLNDPNFIGIDKMGQNSVLLRGQVGQIGQVPVIVSDRATAITDIDSGTAGNQPGYKALLIKRNALTLAYKRRPIVERDRDILRRTNVVTTNVHYAVKRTDDRGIVVIPTGV